MSLEKLQSRLNDCNGEVSSEAAADVIESIRRRSENKDLEDALIDYITDEAIRAETERRLQLYKVEKFEAMYKMLIRVGYAVIIIVPLILLVLMFSLESKLTFLSWWIITILAAAAYLVVVDFLHSRYERWRDVDAGEWIHVKFEEEETEQEGESEYDTEDIH